MFKRLGLKYQFILIWRLNLSPSGGAFFQDLTCPNYLACLLLFYSHSKRENWRVGVPDPTQAKYKLNPRALQLSRRRSTRGQFDTPPPSVFPPSRHPSLSWMFRLGQCVTSYATRTRGKLRPTPHRTGEQPISDQPDVPLKVWPRAAARAVSRDRCFSLHRLVLA